MTETERLLIDILDRMAARFESHAVLRGGMVLRVLGCERFTNDLDYVMVPFRSKKDVVADVVKALKKLEGVSVTHSLNSKYLRMRIWKRSFSICFPKKNLLVWQCSSKRRSVES